MELALGSFSGVFELFKVEIDRLKSTENIMQHNSTIHYYFEVDYEIWDALYDENLFYFNSQFNGLYRHFFTLFDLREGD